MLVKLIEPVPVFLNVPLLEPQTHNRVGIGGNIHVVVSSAIRYGRMPEAERKKLVAGLLAEEGVGKPGCSDLKSLAKQVNSAYLKNLSMTKKRARSILAGKTSSTSVRTALTPSHCYTKAPGLLSWHTFARFSPSSSTTWTPSGRRRAALCGAS